MRRRDVTERMLVAQSSESVAQVIDALDDPSVEVARAAVTRLAELDGSCAVSGLRERLLNSDLSLVADTARTLRGCGDPTVIDLAITGLGQQPYTRRLAAARALAALADRRSADPLRAGLHDPVAGVRVGVLAALAALGPSEATTSECAPLLADPDANVRRAAVSAIVRTSRRPGTHVSGAARDPDRVVRLEVARHLARLSDESARSLLTDPDLRVREAGARGAGIRQVGQLAAMLVEDPSGDVRRAAAQTLGELADERVADVLLAALEDRDALVRASALRAIEKLLTPSRAIRRLRSELGASDARRRAAVVYALARMGAGEAADDVQRLVADEDPDVRLALIHTANVLQAKPEPLIRRLAADADAAVRHSAENWLIRSATRQSHEGRE